MAKRGRPKGSGLPAEERAGNRLQVHVPDRTKDKLERIVKRTGLSMSEVCRKIIEERLGIRPGARGIVRHLPRRTKPQHVGESSVDPAFEKRVRELMQTRRVSENAAQHIAEAERRADA